MALIKNWSFSRILLLAGLAAVTAAGQSYDFDQSGNATLKGKYFVREVVFQNLDAQGNLGEATGVIGIATFDGLGKYTFSGQIADSKTGTNSTSSIGTYAVAANGFLRIASFAMQGAVAYGGVGAVGPSAFTAGATENSSPVFDLVVGIPIAPSVSNASLKGAYNAVYLNIPQAAVDQTRQAYMPLQADGAGGFGAVTAAGSATDNASLTTQAIPKVTYSLSATGGTIDFGAAASNQLIGDTQSFFVSADGKLLVGGSPTGYDLLLASPAASSNPAAAFYGFYYLGRLDADNTTWASQGQSMLEASYGSANSTGQGVYLSHLRLNSNGYSVEDLTSSWQYSMQSDGSFIPGSMDRERYWVGANGQVLLGVGLGNFYSIMAGLHAVNYTPANPATDVFLNPLGIVNAASFAPATNSVAPYEMVTLWGSNLATGPAQALTFPLPTTLLSTQVVVNGVAAPLVAVSPTQITLIVPGAATPDFSAYASFQVTNAGASCPSPAPANSQCPVSAFVTMYTNYTAPGVFALGQNGIGPAVAEDVNYNLIGVNNPAKPGEVAVLALTGMGSVSPVLADGVQSSPTGQPLNWLDIYNNSAMYVYFGANPSPNLMFGGVMPGYPAGLYQINAMIPSGAFNGENYVDILTPDAETEQTTLNIAGASSAVPLLRRPSSTGRRTARVSR